MSAATLMVFDTWFIGPLTPIGGAFLILGWLALGWGILVKKRA
jgi:uncharacterized membrane protein YgdD (TMEM256/DUF423 family)